MLNIGSKDISNAAAMFVIATLVENFILKTSNNHTKT